MSSCWLRGGRHRGCHRFEVRLCQGGDVFGVGIGIEDVGVDTTAVVVVGVGVMLKW